MQPRFVLALLFALVSLFAFAAADDKIWKLCGDSTDLLQVSDILVDPSPPVAGRNFSVTILGTLKSDVTDGNTHLTVNFDDTELLNGDMPLCSSLPDVQCPLKQGPFKMFVKELIPDIAPIGGPYFGNITLTDQNKKRVTCIEYKFFMQEPSGKAAPAPGAKPVDASAPAVNRQIISTVNASPASAWKAGVNDVFAGKTIDNVRRMLGAKNVRTQPRRVFSQAHKQIKLERLRKSGQAPATFDWRKEAPQCVHTIRDQGQCGSCWAFGAANALSDRFCVASKGKVNVVLSPEYLVDCDNGNYGCNGGYLEETWNFIAAKGIPSDECYPYIAGKGQEGICNETCADGKPMHMYKISSVDAYYTEADIMETIAKSGPIEGAFHVYEDFLHYKSGVYHHVSGGLLGGHAIKILGYGKDSASGLEYWICANSWGTTWGDKGYFLIKKGADECGIESNAIAGLPQL